MKREVFGTREKGKKQCGFVCIYTREAAPFENYPYDGEELQYTKLPMTLMCMRYNGKIGFIGGEIKEDEEIPEGIIREVYEEIAYTLVPDRMQPLATFSNDRCNMHSYIYEVSWKELLDILQKSFEAAHFPAEHGGCFIQKMGSHKYSFTENFLNNSFDGSAKEEFMLLNSILEGANP